MAQPHCYSQSSAVTPTPDNAYQTYHSSINDFKVEDTPGDGGFRAPNRRDMGHKADNYAQESVTFCHPMESQTAATLSISSPSFSHPGDAATSSSFFPPQGNSYVTYVYPPQSQLGMYGASLFAEPDIHSSRFPTTIDQSFEYGRIQAMQGSQTNRSIMAPTVTSMIVPALSTPVYQPNHMMQQQQRWMEVVKDRKDSVMEEELVGDSDFEEREIVPVSTPLGGSYEDLSHTLTESNMALTGAAPSSDRTENALRRGSVDKKKRGPLGEDKRKATCDTRSMGACIRCHNQRIRVSTLDATMR